MITQDSRDGLQQITLQNEAVRAVILPELGGKMVSLERRGVEFLLQPPEPERAYRRAAYADAFEDFDTSGFDECMPTVAACVYPEDEFAGAQLPDHGELWSRPWDWEIAGEQLVMGAQGYAMPYRLQKTLRLEGSDLLIEYELTNEGGRAFQYLWSAHPLLALETGDRIVLPAEVTDVLVNWSKHDRLGPHGVTVAWPTSGQGEDLSILQPPQVGRADKLFTGRLRQGACGLHRRARQASLVFRFDPRRVPYVGLWICQGGWPLSRPAKHYTVALEPCSGRPDALSEAIARRECDVLPPLGTKRWDLRLELRDGPPSL